MTHGHSGEVAKKVAGSKRVPGEGGRPDSRTACTTLSWGPPSSFHCWEIKHQAQNLCGCENVSGNEKPLLPAQATGGAALWGREALSLEETLLPSSNAGASETLSPDTIANCHLAYNPGVSIWFLGSSFICMSVHACDYVYELACMLRSEDNLCCCSSNTIHLAF